MKDHALFPYFIFQLILKILPVYMERISDKTNRAQTPVKYQIKSCSLIPVALQFPSNVTRSGSFAKDCI